MKFLKDNQKYLTYQVKFDIWEKFNVVKETKNFYYIHDEHAKIKEYSTLRISKLSGRQVRSNKDSSYFTYFSRLGRYYNEDELPSY